MINDFNYWFHVRILILHLLSAIVDQRLTISYKNNVFPKVHYIAFDLWRHWKSRFTETILLRVLQNSMHAGIESPNHARLRHFLGHDASPEKLSNPYSPQMCAWQADLRDFLGSKDLLVLRPLRHEPTAQYYLPRDSSQRLPSVRETETGFRIRPEAHDWPSSRQARRLYGMLDQYGRRNYTDGAARRTLFSSWNWIDACLRFLVGANQLVAALKQAARWLLPSHSRCQIPLPISSAEAFGFEPSWIRRNGQAKYISVNCAVIYCLTLLSRPLFVFFRMKVFVVEV